MFRNINKKRGKGMKKNKEFEILLIEKGISKTELAEKVGVTWQTIWHWATGRNKPKIDSASKLAEALGITVAEVYKILKGRN